MLSFLAGDPAAAAWSGAYIYILLQGVYLLPLIGAVLYLLALSRAPRVRPVAVGLALLAAAPYWVLVVLKFLEADDLARSIDLAWLVATGFLTTMAVGLLVPLPRSTERTAPLPFVFQLGMAIFLLFLTLAAAGGLAARFGLA